VVTEGSSSWSTPLNGTAGTVMITNLGSGRIAGNFSFTAAQVSGAGTKAVTNGAFDLALTGTPGTVQPYQGSTMKGTLGGTAWIGATIVVNKGGGTFSFIGASQPGVTSAASQSVDIILNGQGPGTYPVGSNSTNLISVIIGNTNYSSSGTGSSGSVVVTSVDANRLKGTFSGTLTGLSAGSLTITNGTFDLGLGK